MTRHDFSTLDRIVRKIPGYDPIASAGECTFDIESASNAADFFAKCLVHIKGEKAGQPFILEEWQRAIVFNLFGWKRPDGARRYREAFIFVPRKNGKSLMAAGICNFMLFCDGEQGAEIYAAAAERDQAALVFELAKQQVLRERVLSRVATVYQRSIVIKQLAASFKAISADANTKHGYNAHCVVVDELHAQKDRELVDVLDTSMASRRQPLMVYITTSDYDRESICNEKYDYAVKVRDGIIQDQEFLPVIYEAARDDDWQDPKIWAKANPCLGVSFDIEYMRRKCQRAKDSPAFENTFKRLHLNIKTEQDMRWLAMERWDACGGGLIDPTALEGRPCYAGLDLSTTTDITALVLVFPGDDERYSIIPFFWIPADKALERERRDRVPYTTWARQGYVEMTHGNVIDYDVIHRRLNELWERFDIQEIAFDRWNATHLVTQLAGDGFELSEFGQGYKDMSAPTKHLEKLILSQQIKHGNHPVLRWMASNIVIDMDAAGNIKPNKAKSTERIDGIVAMIMAIGRIVVAEQYEETFIRL